MYLPRRQFVISAAAMTASAVFAANNGRIFKVGLVGCGDRGKGALRDIKLAAKRLGCEVRLTAAADFFKEKALVVTKADGLDDSLAFCGANGYKQVLDSGCEIVLLCTPPFFRARHAAAAIAAGKHVFAEKPIATDPRGLRDFLKTAAEAKKANLSILAGTLHRHSNRFLKQIGPVRNGAIGKIMAGRVYRCHGKMWVRPRRPEDTNASYLCNNWYHFWEMSGDQVTEQAIHEQDLANWFIGRAPISALGMGGRWRRPEGIGNIYDEIAIDYDYGDDLHVTTLGRHMDGCANPFGTRLVGTEGEISIGGRIRRFDGKPVEEDLKAIEGRDDNGLIMEHADFLSGIISGKLLNEGEQVAMSTATCIMGTLAAYSGRQVRMKDILENERSEFFNGWNAGFAAADFENTSDIPLPAEGKAIVPGKE